MNNYNEPIQSYATPESAPQKANNKTLIIVLVVVLVLCCCCVIFGLLMYFVLGDPIMEALDMGALIPAALMLL